MFKPNRIILYELIKRYSKFIKGDVLDIGAGPKDRYSELFKYNNYTKIDLDDKTGAVVVDARHTGYPDEHFDSFVCFQVLEHIYDYQRAIKEMYRILKKGGCGMISVPMVNELHEEPNDFWRFTKYSLQHDFEEQGFKIMFLDRMGGFYATIAMLISRYYRNSMADFIAKILFRLDKRNDIYIFKEKYPFEVIQHYKNDKITIGWFCVVRKL